MGTGSSGIEGGTVKKLSFIKWFSMKSDSSKIESSIAKNDSAEINHSFAEDGYKLYSNSEVHAAEATLNTDNATESWLKNITDKEEAATSKYTGSYYKKLNANMRKGKETLENRRDVKNIESALDKYELKKTMVFTRGSSADLLGGASTVEDIQKMVGKVVVDKAFVSTAVAGTGFNKPITYHILTNPGKGIGAYVKPISMHKGENEFLFNRNSGFMIRGAYVDGDGHVHCNMEYVGRIQ